MSVIALLLINFSVGFLIGQSIQTPPDLMAFREKSQVIVGTQKKSTSPSKTSALPSVSPPSQIPFLSNPCSLLDPHASEPSLDKGAGAFSPTMPSAPENTEIQESQTVPLQPNPDRKITSSAPPPADTYTLQIAAFREKDRAQQLVEDLQKKGYTPYIIAADTSRKEFWYLVRMGSFQSAELARQYAQILAEKEKIGALVWKTTPSEQRE